MPSNATIVACKYVATLRCQRAQPQAHFCWPQILDEFAALKLRSAGIRNFPARKALPKHKGGNVTIKMRQS